MKYIISGDDAKKIDNYTINNIGVPSLVLMERAALSVTQLIVKNESKDKSVLVVVGTGNNGADGLAICRMLYLKGYRTCIYILGDLSKATKEFTTQLNIIKKLGVKISESYIKADVIVDGIFGVGLSRNIEGQYAEIIKKINKEHAIVYAVDIPSGVNADNGKICDISVKADYTVTFGSHKIGTVLYPGADVCGKVVVADIGFPQKAYENLHVLKYVTKEELSYLPVRPNYSNKGTFGRVLIIAGSKDITGAAYLCAKAAFRIGAGLVRIFTVKENKDVIAKLLPEAMVNTYDTDNFDIKALHACLNWCDAVAIGPGLSTGNIQKSIVEQVLISKHPTVIDADGINNIAGDNKLKKLLHKKVIITPHVAEMSRLLNVPVKDIADDVVRYAKEANYRYNVISVLKDARTVIALKDECYVNLTGNNGMATAGSGDVLTGIIIGLISIGVDFEKAAILGPYIHGLSGDYAVEKMSKASLMASDIIEQLKELG